MLDQLRDQIAMYLSEHDECVLITRADEGVGALPVRYRNRGLELQCLIPSWADVLYYLEQNPAVLILVPDVITGATRWLAYEGTARFAGAVLSLPQTDADPFSPGDQRFRLVEIEPHRIDLIDQRSHWGARTTLDLEPPAQAP